MDYNLQRNTFESVNVQVQTTEAPKIKAGGSSSSNILNRFFNGVIQDISMMATRLNKLSSRAQRVLNVANAQGQAYSNAFNQLLTRINAASGFSQVLADLHNNYYVNTGTTTAQINYQFGQATLPIIGMTDLLVQQDLYGNNYISSDTNFYYTFNTITNPTTGNISGWQLDPDGIYMLRGDQTWLVDVPAGASLLWVMIKAPLQYRGLIPNVMEIWPLPIFSSNLIGAWYQNTNSSVWNSIDITYQPNYQPTGTYGSNVGKFGPVRFHLDNQPITQLIFCIDTTGLTSVGLQAVKIYHFDYNTTSVLNVQNPYSTQVNSSYLRGKNPASTLSTLPITITNNQVVINLSSSDSTSTPVITGVIMS